MSVAIWNRILENAHETGIKNPADWIEVPAHQGLRQYLEQLAGLPPAVPSLEDHEIQNIVDDLSLGYFWRALVCAGQAMRTPRTSEDRQQDIIRALKYGAYLPHGSSDWEYIQCLHYQGRHLIPGDEHVHHPDLRTGNAATILQRGWRLPPSWPHIERPQLQQEAEPIRRAG